MLLLKEVSQASCWLLVITVCTFGFCFLPRLIMVAFLLAMWSELDLRLFTCWHAAFLLDFLEWYCTGCWLPFVLWQSDLCVSQCFTFENEIRHCYLEVFHCRETQATNTNNDQDSSLTIQSPTVQFVIMRS